MFLEPPNVYTQFTKVLILSNVKMLLFKTGKMTNKKQTQRSSRPDVFYKKGFLTENLRWLLLDTEQCHISTLKMLFKELNLYLIYKVPMF